MTYCRGPGPHPRHEGRGHHGQAREHDRAQLHGGERGPGPPQPRRVLVPGGQGHRLDGADGPRPRRAGQPAGEVTNCDIDLTNIVNFDQCQNC